MASPWFLEAGRPAADCRPAFGRQWRSATAGQRSWGGLPQEPRERPRGAHVYEMDLK